MNLPSIVFAASAIFVATQGLSQADGGVAVVDMAYTDEAAAEGMLYVPAKQKWPAGFDRSISEVPAINSVTEFNRFVNEIRSIQDEFYVDFDEDYGEPVVHRYGHLTEAKDRAIIKAADQFLPKADSEEGVPDLRAAHRTRPQAKQDEDSLTMPITAQPPAPPLLDPAQRHLEP